MAETPRTIIYTHTDEAPALATYSLLPIVQPFTRPPASTSRLRDISLAARILAVFADFLDRDQRVADDLAELGELVTRPEANIIKLPNISASVPQLRPRSRSCGPRATPCPTTPTSRRRPAEIDIKARYDKVKGSAVNPVLREGNSDRRAPASVKHYARNHPHSMGAWSRDSKTSVAHMDGDDFRSNEQSVTMAERRHAADRARRRPTARSPCSRSRSRCWPARWSTPPR